MRLQRNALPVACGVARQPMLNLVPFARAKGKMADLHHQARAIGKALQLNLPKSVSMTIATTAVRSNQQTLRGSIALAAHPFPPLRKRGDGKLGGVMVDSDQNPGAVAAQVVNTKGNRFAQLVVGKVARIQLSRFALGTVGPPWILAVSQHFFLPRIDRDSRLSSALASRDTAVDVFKLRVLIGMWFALSRFAVRLQAVAFFLQKPGNLGMAQRKPQAFQFGRQRSCTLASPPQRRHRIASSRRFDPAFQLSDQLRRLRFSGRTTSAGSALAAWSEPVR